MDAIFFLVIIILPAMWVTMEVLRKAGYPKAWAIPLMLTGYLGMLVLASKEWPIERELAWLRFKNVDNSHELLASVERHAIDLEKAGDWKKAALVFDELRRRSSDDSNAYYANCLKRLNERMGDFA